MGTFSRFGHLLKHTEIGLMGNDPFHIGKMDAVKGSCFFGSLCKSLDSHANRFIGFDHPQSMKFLIDAFIGDGGGLRPTPGKKEIFTICPVRVDVDGKDLADLLSLILRGLTLPGMNQRPEARLPLPHPPKGYNSPDLSNRGFGS